MAEPGEGRSSTNEFFEKGTSLSNAQANDKLVEHTKSSIGGGTSFMPDDAESYKKEQDDIQAKEESADDFDSSNGEVYEGEGDVASRYSSTKGRKRSRRTIPVKSAFLKLFYFLSQLREMFIRRFLRAFSHIFRSFTRYQRGKVLNEANYQQLSSASNGVLKLKKMVNDAKNKTREAKASLSQYMSHDYKDPRNFIRDSKSLLSKGQTVSVGGGIKIELSTKDLIENVNSEHIMGRVKGKIKKEFREEKEEILEFRKNILSKKLSYGSKSISERAEVKRHEETSFRATGFKRALPSLKRFIIKEDIKVKVKSTWASLARHILYKAKPYSDRFRTQKTNNYNFAETFRLPTSRIAAAGRFHRKDIFG